MHTIQLHPICNLFTLLYICDTLLLASYQQLYTPAYILRYNTYLQSIITNYYALYTQISYKTVWKFLGYKTLPKPISSL